MNDKTETATAGRQVGRRGYNSKKTKIITVFPKGTVVKFEGVPCALLQDTPYYSATFNRGAETEL